MKKGTFLGNFGLILGVLALLAVPAIKAEAGVKIVISSPTYGYHGGGHRAWDRYDRTIYDKDHSHPGKAYEHKKRHKHKHDYDILGHVRYLPYGTKKIRYDGILYRYNDGTFYRKCKRGYDIVSPPYGISVRRLPIGVRKAYNHGKKYYYHDGNYYRKIDKKYRIVKEPDIKFSSYDKWHHPRYSSHNVKRSCD